MRWRGDNTNGSKPVEFVALEPEGGKCQVGRAIAGKRACCGDPQWGANERKAMPGFDALSEVHPAFVLGLRREL
jgi:hypothetical protein